MRGCCERNSPILNREEALKRTSSSRQRNLLPSQPIPYLHNRARLVFCSYMDQRAWTAWNIADLGLRDTTHFKSSEQYSRRISDKRATRLNSTTANASKQLHWNAIVTASGDIPVRLSGGSGIGGDIISSHLGIISERSCHSSRELPHRAGRLRDCY